MLPANLNPTVTPSRRPLIAGLALFLCASACAPIANPYSPYEAPRSASLEVRNEQWSDLTVYVERDGALFRLGTVVGLTTRVLQVPAEYLPRGGAIRLRAMRPGARATASSVLFSILPGQSAAWVAARTSGPTGVVVR